jgi:hypothetical protein
VVDSPSGSSGSGSRDGRKGTSDRTTTTAAGDDRRPSDDDDRERIEPVPRRGDSVVASDSDAGSTTVTTAGRRSTTTTTRPATTTTTTAPDPPSLASWSVAWSSGTLRVTVQSPSGTADTHSVVVTVNLSSGAHVASLDGGCSGSGPVTCTIAAPEAGSATAVSIGLTVDGPGETATVSARQGSNSLGSQSVSLAVEAAA